MASDFPLTEAEIKNIKLTYDLSSKSGKKLYFKNRFKSFHVKTLARKYKNHKPTYFRQTRSEKSWNSFEVNWRCAYGKRTK